MRIPVLETKFCGPEVGKRERERERERKLLCGGEVGIT
jgi:hypothetical protein